ncbi:MAG: HD-GYP domain-containing protein [Spirochaetes bacterium]|nr:HD-GYP domain-containing protein [Spirochaetota bacterium]
MSKNENLLVKINEYFLEHHIPAIYPENTELKNLFQVSLANIWKSITHQKKRDLHATEVSHFFVQFFGSDNINKFLAESAINLNKKYPQESDYVELYNWCLNQYALFEKEYLNTEHINVDLLESIYDQLMKLIQENQENIISYMGTFRKKFSSHTIHEINSTIIALMFAYAKEYSEERTKTLCMASLLHDLGMLKVPDDILNKEGKLTDEEFNLIKSHTISIYKELKLTKLFTEEVLTAVVQHHEHYDGSGYPQKLAGEKISDFAKIIAIADAFEAQISARSYRRTKNRYLAMRELMTDVKKSFDPKFFQTFLNTISLYPPGSLVQLNDDSIGLVTGINKEVPMRPLIKILITSDGIKVNGKIIVDLARQNHLYIVYVLNKSEYQKKN